MVKIEPAALVLAVGTAMGFGSANWLAGYLPSIGHPPLMMVAIWLLVPTMILTPWSLLQIYRVTKGMQNFIIDGNGAPYTERRPWIMAILHCVLSTIGSTLGSILILKSFGADLRNIGPLSAIIATDVLITAVICHFALKEKLSLFQWGAVLLIFVGIAVMFVSTDTSGSTDNSDTTTTTTTAPGEEVEVEGDFAMALAWGLGATMCFVVANMGVKCAFQHNINPHSLNFARMLTQVFGGLIVLIIALYTQNPAGIKDAENDENLVIKRWCLNIFQAVCHVFGLACLTMALRYKCTGITLSVVGAGVGSVGFILNLIHGKVPSIPKIIGMAIVVTGVALMPILANVQKNEEEETKKGDENDAEVGADEVKKGGGDNEHGEQEFASAASA